MTFVTLVTFVLPLRERKLEPKNMRSDAKQTHETHQTHGGSRAWRKLAAAVPRAVKDLTERKTKLEAQIDAGKTLSPRAQRELEKIRALLDQHHSQQILIRALLNSMGLEKIHATVRQSRLLTRKPSGRSGGARRP